MTHHRTAAALADLRTSELRADASGIRLARTLRRTLRSTSASPRGAA